VIDTGPGINRSFLPHVFDRFRQADSTSTRTQGGLGIGLTIVRHIVELHGGAVRADSAGEGHGSIFTVSLPVATEAAKSTPAIEGEPSHDESHDLEGVRILLVDDEQDAREVVSEILRRFNAEVSVAASVAEAMDQMGSYRPDVIISDIAMPDADGYDFLRRVRALPPEQGGLTPAIALTAYARPVDRILTLESGFQSHLAKPIEPRTLVHQIVSLKVTSDVHI